MARESGGRPMDKSRIMSAVNTALASGVVPAELPPNVHPESDEAYLRKQTHVAIEQPALDALIGDFEEIPELAGLKTKLASNAVGCMAFEFRSLAKLLLARVLKTGDLEQSVEIFCDYITSNSARSHAVMALSNVNVAEQIRLGPDIALLPIADVPKSYERGDVLGQGRYPRLVAGSGAVHSALITEFSFGPVFFEQTTPPGPSPAAQGVSAARSLLEEARLLLGILGVYSTTPMIWLQPVDPMMIIGLSGRGFVGYERDNFRTECSVSKEIIEPLAQEYFAIPEAKRRKHLRIPLDRLNRAGREFDFADRAIDLGIALESLLLADSSAEQGELKFRLSLRGSYLFSTNPQERAATFNDLGTTYRLRSRAVHGREIGRTQETQESLKKGTTICQTLIKNMIARKCEVQWNELVLGHSQ